jgi:UDP-glucose 4-epimerase
MSVSTLHIYTSSDFFSLFFSKVAMGRREFISVGNDFDTPDGTSVRDYIHVMDLAEGHLKALKKLQEKAKHYAVYNLGIGRGISVREMIDVSARID